MHPPASLTLLLSLSTTANAFPVLDFLLYPRDKPAKSYSVVNVEGSPSTGSPDVVTVTREPAQVTVTERVSDPVTQISCSPVKHRCSRATSIIIRRPPAVAFIRSSSAIVSLIQHSWTCSLAVCRALVFIRDPSAVVCLAEHFSALALAIIRGLSVILLGDKYAPAIRTGLKHP
ncbi:hypothetical protein CBS470a_013361 [Colletotrichum nupharicola]|nr:hypothetical protein CBS470a_013361 [Colletotrichum nupharicola]